MYIFFAIYIYTWYIHIITVHVMRHFKTLLTSKSKWYVMRQYHIYIYIWSPPPHDPPTSILYGNYQCFMHIFFTRKMTFSCFYFFWHSHVSISFTYYVSCRPRHTHMQFCFCLLFCHFLRFWSKTQKTLRKPKKQKKQNCKTHVGTSWWVRVCNFVFFVFFWFLEAFNTFGQKPKKHWENQKNQKNKIARPM